MKILFLDIETSPNLVYSWGLFKQNIAINQIVEPGQTMCWAAKWEGQAGIQFASVKHDGMKRMVKRMYALLNEADAVVHYNGKKFDIPTLGREFVLLELVPPTNYKEIDLYSTVRQKFRFASNKLDFVAQQLGLGSKVQHKGMELWRDCMAGDEKAWKLMERYNKQDVRLLEPLYKKLQPWISNHPNRGLWLDNEEQPTCRNCGSTKIVKKGLERTTTMTYQRYKCADCGTNLRGRKRLLPAPDGLLV